MLPLVIIPARGGSKGVPRKNIKLLNEKPLIEYTIETARFLFTDEVICVSTDDLEIKEVVERLGLNVPFIRPKALALDTSGTYDVLIHAIEHYKKKDYIPDTIVLLQATSPFRNALHLKKAIELYEQNPECEMLVSVKETTSNPYYVHFEDSEEGFLKKTLPSHYMRRQDCPKVYELNGAIYIINATALKQKKMHEFTKIIKFQMDEISSHDIDTQIDWLIAEILLKQL